MAKKTTKKSTKKTAKKAAKKVTKKTAKKTTKKTAKKPAAKKATKKKAATKKVAKKTAKKTTKKSTKKAASKKTTKKKVSKKTTKKKPAAKKTTKKVTKKKAAKKAATKKTSSAKSTKKAPAKKDAVAAKDAKPAAEAKSTDSKPAKKMRSRNRKKNPTDYAPPPRPLLLGPGSKLAGGPLIASTKRPKKSKAAAKVSKRTKTPFTPKQLDDYKLTLLKKRAELVGDVEHLEEEALRSSSGETQTASNAAEFGSESFEQSLNLDLAAADRQLINEIDEALERIANRTYGLCIESHEPISKARLAELPWAKYSIETARKHDQHYKR